MGLYEFEIQVLIKVKGEGVNKEDARCGIESDLEDGFFDDELIKDASISDGTKIEKK